MVGWARTAPGPSALVRGFHISRADSVPAEQGAAPGEQPEPDPPDPPRPAEGGAAEIVFHAVTKRYRGRARPAVDSLSLAIPAGEICVLVGPSGGGKTTAMKMVNSLIDITEGDITIDGRSVRQMNGTELRRRIGYVIQQVG